MGEPQEMENPVVIQAFVPNSGPYFECLNCRTHIALLRHRLNPISPGMGYDDRAFSKAMNVYAYSPAEDEICVQTNCIRTNVYCINCNQIIGFRYVQVAQGNGRPRLGEFRFDRVGAIDFRILDPNLGDYYECWRCDVRIALHSDILPQAPGMRVESGAFLAATDVHAYPNRPEEALVLPDCTCTRVYCTCGLFLGFRFIQVAQGMERPRVGEYIFNRRRLIRITYVDPNQINQVAEDDDDFD